MDVGQKIRKLREKHGFKQVNLANALQVSPQAVSKWEKGANYPDIDMLMKIARLFDVSADYLLGITDAGSGVFEATVFCSALSHFAQRSISMSSKEVADHANMIFYHLTESVLKHDGIPVKYVGDGFLCFFSGPNHADRALKAAIRAKKAIYQKDLVIGLNSGEIYLGLMGHPDYAARDIVGETVNRAFLIAAWASGHCPSGIGAAETVMARAEEHYEMSRHHGVEVDLIEGSMDIYEIKSENTAHDSTEGRRGI
jgi:class 3 adenylate cyclase